MSGERRQYQLDHARGHLAHRHEGQGDAEDELGKHQGRVAHLQIPAAMNDVVEGADAGHGADREGDQMSGREPALQHDQRQAEDVERMRDQ